MLLVVCQRDNRLASRQVSQLCSRQVSLQFNHLPNLLADLPLHVMLVISSSTALMACIQATHVAASLVSQGNLTQNLEVSAKSFVACVLKANIRIHLAVRSVSQPLLGRLLQGQGQPALRSVPSLLTLPAEVTSHAQPVPLVGSLPEKVRLESSIVCPRSGILFRAALLLYC